MNRALFLKGGIKVNKARIMYSKDTNLFVEAANWAMLGFGVLSEDDGFLTISEAQCSPRPLSEVLDFAMIKKIEDGGGKVIEKNW